MQTKTLASKGFRQMRKIAFLGVLILALLVTGCSTNQEPTEDSSPQNTSQTTTYPLTVRDDTGTEITLDKKPQRIVCLAPATTEILFSLSLEGRVVAVTKYDNNPEGVQDKVEYIFDDSLNPNVEQLLNLNPDLIVLGMHPEDAISAMRNLGIPVVQMNPQSIEATYKAIEKFGLITDTQSQATTVVNSMQQKEQAIADKVASIDEAQRVSVWIEVDPDLYTAGEGSFLDELIKRAGGINIASSVQGYGRFNEEQIITANPQIILDTYSYFTPNVKETILNRRGWQNIDAVKNERIYDLDSDMVTRPGPRIIDGLETVAQALYPDLFNE